MSHIDNGNFQLKLYIFNYQTELSLGICPSGTHNITPTTLWWWASYAAPQSGSTPDTSWEGVKCSYGHRRSLRGRTGSVRPYGGPCQNPTQGTDIKTRGYWRRRGGLSTKESPREGGREYT